MLFIILRFVIQYNKFIYTTKMSNNARLDLIVPIYVYILYAKPTERGTLRQEPSLMWRTLRRHLMPELPQ